MQAMSVELEHSETPLTVTDVYCSPCHSISKEKFDHFLENLGNKLILGWDFNAKNQYWAQGLQLPEVELSTTQQ